MELENAATRFVMRMHEVFDPYDEPAFLALHAENFRHDDRRPGLQHVVDGVDEIKEYVEVSHDVGTEKMRHIETIAIRGDRLCLTRRMYSNVDGFESEQIVIDQVDEAGRVTLAIVFDPSDLDAAIAELDALHAQDPNG